MSVANLEAIGDKYNTHVRIAEYLREKAAHPVAEVSDYYAERERHHYEQAEIYRSIIDGSLPGESAIE